jgi:hypothetical protein
MQELPVCACFGLLRRSRSEVQPMVELTNHIRALEVGGWFVIYTLTRAQYVNGRLRPAARN